MPEEKIVHMSVGPDPDALQPFRPAKPLRRRSKRTRAPGKTTSDPGGGTATHEAESPPTSPPSTTPSWRQFLRTADNASISRRFAEEANAVLASFGTQLADYCTVALLDSDTYISDFELDRTFAALRSGNPSRDKNVLLFLLSPGGSIEPAYQMSKLCKSFARNRFVVAVPRQAKSAATLLAIGADEIHMGPLGHLGPIDPQLGGLPALGVSQALKSIAAVSEQYPGSSEMLSKYLKLALTVEQIGYCERISESAAQYAERLLQTKTNLPQAPKLIANSLVQDYKDHGFVIDLDEARQHLGEHWIKAGTPEVQAAERLYNLFDEVNLFLNIFQRKRLLVIGGITAGDTLILDRQHL